MNTTKYSCDSCGAETQYFVWYSCPNCGSYNIKTEMLGAEVKLENVKVAEGELLTWMKKAAKNIKKENY